MDEILVTRRFFGDNLSYGTDNDFKVMLGAVQHSASTCARWARPARWSADRSSDSALDLDGVRAVLDRTQADWSARAVDTRTS